MDKKRCDIMYVCMYMDEKSFNDMITVPSTVALIKPSCTSFYVQNSFRYTHNTEAVPM